MAFMAVAAPYLAMAGAGLQAVSSISGGVAASNAANYQAAVARNNATIAQQNAVRAEQAGAAAAENESRKGASKVAKIKVAQAASGVDVNTGTAVDVQAGQRETNQLDTETVFQNSMLHAYGYRTQAQNFESEARLDEMKGEAAKTAGYLGAAGSLLSNASSIGGKWGGGATWGGGAPATEAEELASGVRPV